MMTMMTMKKKWTTTQHRPSVIWRLCIGYNGKFMKNYNRIHRNGAKWHGGCVAQKRSTLKVVTLPIMTVTWCGSIGDIWQQTRWVEAPECRCLARMRNIDTCNTSSMDITSLSLFLQNHVQPNTQMNHSMLRTKTSFTYQLYVANIKQNCPVLWSSFAVPILKHILSIADCIHQTGHKNVAPFEDTVIQWRAEIFTLAGLYFNFLFLFLEDRATWCSRVIFIGRVARTWAKIHHPFTTCPCGWVQENSSFWLGSDRNFLFWRSTRQLSFLVPKLQNTDPTVGSAVNPPLHVYTTCRYVFLF